MNRFRVLYRHHTREGDHGLAVAISRDGLHVTQVDDLSSNPGFQPGQYLKLSNTFSWAAYRNRVRCYAGDTGRGPLRQRLVAAAISLLAWHGGAEEITDHLDLSL